MLFLSGTDKLQLVTDAAVNVDVHASFVDQSGTTITPGRQNTAISTATTTDVVAAPGGSVIRNIKLLTIRNKDTGASVNVTVRHNSGTTVDLEKATVGPDATLLYVEGQGFVEPSATVSIPNWYGKLYAAYGRCDPQQLLRMATMSGTVAATPTNITASIARISYFRPPADIVVNKVRYYGVGATTNVYRIALYNGDTLARLTAETAFTTVANTWGEVFSALNLTLSKDHLYFLACSVNTTGTTAGVLCMNATTAATTGQIAVLPKSWPGNLDIDTGYMDGAFAQFAVTTGALPDPAATIAAQAAWTGGMPLFFLDNSNA